MCRRRVAIIRETEVNVGRQGRERGSSRTGCRRDGGSVTVCIHFESLVILKRDVERAFGDAALMVCRLRVGMRMVRRGKAAWGQIREHVVRIEASRSRMAFFKSHIHAPR